VSEIKVETPIHVEEVWKTYGAIAAVRGLSLSVPPQSVYGFLGPNGAGKSTTIRMVLGLQRPSRGTISLFGRPLARERIALLRRIGSLVESPSLYLHLTGRENLEVHRRLLGLPTRAIDDALEAVDLIPVAGRLVRNYSSGMKQRLGLAQALLGNPELLLLDEPTNGLDPAGIHEVRTLIRDLPSRRGVTIFLSSHLLAEVEQIATHLAIISQGQLKFEGKREELQSRGKRMILVQVDRPERAQELLSGLGLAVTFERNRMWIAPDDQYESAQINTILVNAGIAVSHGDAELDAGGSLPGPHQLRFSRDGVREPMTLSRVLHAELLKMKRTVALRMVLISPAAVVLLVFLAAYQAPFSTLNFNGIRNKWTVLASLTLRAWAILMMPLYITLETALVAGLDHSENQWKSLLARSVPRWTLYVAKLLVVMAMTVLSTLILLCGILIGGIVLAHAQSEVVFGFPIPWVAIFLDGAKVMGLAFLALTIQHWVSLRWRSFSVSIGTGILALVIGFFAVASGQLADGWIQYFPWALPMLVLARRPHNIEAALLISSAFGLAVAAAGCLDFCRREVK
jgi:ABC-type multidrug transport system ATPase subunit